MEHSRLDRATDRRDRIRAAVERIKGHREAAQAEVASVEEESRERGVEPELLDDTIDQLTERYDRALVDLESRLAKAEAALQPFTGESVG